MRLLIDGRSIGDRGGIGRATRSLVVALASARPDWYVTVATSGDTGFTPPRGASLELRDLGVWRARGNILNLASRALLWPSLNLRRHVLTSRPDCLWCTDFYAPLRAVETPIVLSIYDLRFFDLPLPADRPMRLWVTSVRRAIAASASVANAVVVPSEYVATRVRMHLDLQSDTEVHTVPLGVTPPPSSARSALPAGVAEPFVLVVGAEPWRRHRLIAEALSYLAEEDVRLALVVVGAADRLALGDFPANVQVHQLGVVSDETLWTL